MTDTGSVRETRLDRPPFPEASINADGYDTVIPQWATDLAANQVAMQQTLDEILAKFDEMAGEIKPTLDAVLTHPFARMLGLGKEK
jgi:hypothetical protein